MTNKYWWWVLFVFALLAGSSQVRSQGNEFLIKNFKKAPNDIAARRSEVRDVNDVPCALIKVKTGLDNLSFKSNLGITEVRRKTGEYWVYISEREQRIEFIKEGYAAKAFHFPDDYQVASYDVFHLTLSSSLKYPITVNRTPEDAKVYLDGDLRIDDEGQSTIEKVRFGRHVIRLEKFGYASIEDTIFVKQDQFEFTYRLDEVNKVPVSFKTKPEGAEIFIDGTRRGQSNMELFLYPGKYNMRLYKDHYAPVERELVVKGEGQNVVRESMDYNMGNLNIETNVKDPTILIDGTPLHSPTGDTLLTIEEHKITVKKNKYKNKTRWKKPLRGRNQSTQVNFFLKPITGKLLAEVYPEDATVTLYRGDQQISRWTGSKIKPNLMIGHYRMKIERKNYESRLVRFNIEQDRETQKSIHLKAYKRKPGSKGNAFLWSLFIPGAGQYYSTRSNGRGAFYMISALVAGGSWFYLNNEIASLSHDYDQLHSDYRQASTNLDQYKTEMEDKYDQMKQYEEYREYALIVAGSAYALSLLDALIFGGQEVAENQVHSAISREGPVNVSVFPGPRSVTVGVSLTF